MGGIYIDCGTFSSEDKSGKAILFVLAGMHALADPVVLPPLTRLIASVSVMLHTSAPTVTEVSPGDADALLPCLRRYRMRLEQLLDPIRDRHVAIENDRMMGLAGTGRQYSCVLDLERAFAVSVSEHLPAIISWD